MKIAIIGGGNMGGAFARGLLAKKTILPSELLIVERNRARREDLGELGCDLCPDIVGDLLRYDVILLAVKPQDFAEVAIALVPALLPSQLVISLMAGISVGTLKRRLDNHQRIVRAMPNLPAQAGLGITVYCLGAGLDSRDLEMADTALTAVGLSIGVKSEELIDVATAISGNGPAYLYYLIEALSEQAETLGFNREEAKMLVEHTFHGSMHMLRQSGESAAKLRQRVTSEGGTSEAAIGVLTEHKVKDSLALAVQSAIERAKSLGH